MKKIKFLKMNGQGNDFILIDSLEKELSFSTKEIARMCNRHFGIGADGLILVKKSEKADFLMDYYNQDGTNAEMCGNGIRCMAGFILLSNLSDKKNMYIETRAGIKKVEIRFENVVINDRGKADNSLSFNGIIKVDMGKPVFEPDKIPVRTPRNAEIFNRPEVTAPGNSHSARNGLIIKDYILNISGKDFNINCLSVGNPHCVIFLDDETEINEFPVSRWGSEIENHKMFPNKTNIEFIKIKNGSEIEMRVWERGVGETLACGTGACAAAVCAIEHNKINTSRVYVYLPGGILSIYWQQGSYPVFLEGTVETVYSGTYII